MEIAERACFHCGEPVPPSLELCVEIDGRRRRVCCAGCQAVAQLIHSAGLGRYYRFRTAAARRIDPAAAEARAAWSAVDGREALWGRASADGNRELLLQTEGIRCAACAWLIRSRLETLSGIQAVQVDAATGFTRILWDPARTRLSHIAGALFDLGYLPHLPLTQAEEAGRQAERRGSLQRLGVAGLGMMQVMMYAVGLYAGDHYGDMSGAARSFLGWVSLVVTLPVLLYSGRVYFRGAWKGLRAGRPGMDLPVAVAITLAFTASCTNFFRGEGEIWFDSVVMFIFFLTLGRHVELVLRHRNLQAGAALARLLPEWAHRIAGSTIEIVPAADLTAGDRVRVPPGTAFPCDGRIVTGCTEVDESLVSGESRALLRRAGDGVIAGSINLTRAVEVEATAAAGESTVSALGRLLLDAQVRRTGDEGLPAWLVPAFSLGVLLLASGTGLFWLGNDPALAFPAALAVLVASCPCALSLALPAVNAAATRGLLQAGILLTRGTALHRLPRVTTVVFDKTGTLTRGHPERIGYRANPARPEFGEDDLLGIAAALESHSAHPVARAFHRTAAPLPAADVSAHPGQGLEGVVAGRRWRIGSAAFVAPGANLAEAAGSVTTIWLGDSAGWAANWTLADALRPGGEAAVRELRTRGLKLHIGSGDAASAVQPVAGALGIDSWQSRRSPQQKVELIRSLQRQNEVVLMVGDGVNDAPVLASADVSMTVQGATQLANSSADLILTAESLDRIREAFTRADKAMRLVWQNLGWALLYNLSVLPLAMSGALKPWMAALGMSASSLLVVLNATRMVARPRSRSEPAALPHAGEAIP